jgi:hypothetical protein
MKRNFNIWTLLFSLMCMSLLSCEKEEITPVPSEPQPTVKLKPEKKIAKDNTAGNALSNGILLYSEK